jgi:hypothetical protein
MRSSKPNSMSSDIKSSNQWEVRVQERGSHRVQVSHSPLTPILQSLEARQASGDMQDLEEGMLISFSGVSEWPTADRSQHRFLPNVLEKHILCLLCFLLNPRNFQVLDISSC